MNNLIIYGSPNKSSFTMELLKKVTAEKFENSYLYNCFEKSPKPCDGCGLCKVKDFCKYDDLKEFFESFENSDEVFFAFPVYNGSFPAPLKALIDRFQIFYNARFFKNKRPPIEGVRQVTLIITAGGKIDPLPLITAQLKPIFTVCGCKLKKAFVLSGTDGDAILSTTDF